MARPYARLRGKLAQYELTNDLLARKLLLTPSTVSRKLNGHSPWTSDEMWQIMELVGEPAHLMHRLFPKDGQNEEGCTRMKGVKTA